MSRLLHLSQTLHPTLLRAFRIILRIPNVLWTGSALPYMASEQGDSCNPSGLSGSLHFPLCRYQEVTTSESKFFMVMVHSSYRVHGWIAHAHVARTLVGYS